jgi:crotonobetainyl-CoA:carnitine CoA-transferase CaiB-like acyl-CoA transferase
LGKISAQPADAESVLSGVRVIDLAQGAAGPVTAATLAEYGADVLKVEPPTGDYARRLSGFEIWNRNKRSITLDLASAPGRLRLRELLALADVLLEDAQPSSALSALLADAAAESGILRCRLSAFGPASAPEDRPGHEGVVAAEAGFYLGIDELFGAAPQTPRNRPIFTIAPTGSFAAAQLGAQAVLAGIVAALRERPVRVVESSLLQGNLSMLMRRAFARVDESSGRAPARGRTITVQRGIALTFLTVECSDGRWLQMCARQDRHFLSWLRTIGLEEATQDPRYARGPMTIPSLEDIDELEGRIRAAMRAKPADDWLTLFSAASVGADPFLHPSEFLDHPNTVANRFVSEWADTGGKTLSAPAALTATPAVPLRHLIDGEFDWSTPRILSSPQALPGLQTSQAQAEGPLSGLLILEVAYFLAAPLATTLLAELGARVIKVEPPGGDPWRRTGTEVVHILHGKESIELDLKQPEGLDILHRLIGGADALIQSFRPGVADRLGLGYKTCHRINPRLVYVFSTGYGSHGPLATQPAFHSSPNAWSGGGILQGGVGNPPVDCSYPDPASGLVNATAILLGLCARERFGHGQYIETSMLLSGAHVLSNWYTDKGMQDFHPQDGRQRGLGACYRLYECRDGWIFVSAPSAAAWNDLCGVIGQAQWALTDQPRSWPELLEATKPFEASLEAVFVQCSANEAVEQLRGRRFAVVRADARPLEDYLEGQGLLAAASHVDFGNYWKLPAKFVVDGRRPPVRDAPRIGQHSADIAAEVGLDELTIAELFRKGVLGAPEATAAVTPHA